MTNLGFWTEGPSEHHDAYEKHLASLKEQLKTSPSEDDQARIKAEIEETREKLKLSDDPEILW